MPDLARGLRPLHAARSASSAAARLLVALALVGGLSGCTIKETYVHPDYDAAYRHTVKRVAVLVRVEGDHPPEVAEMAGRMARRYINQKRDFLVLRQARDEAEGGPPRAEVLAGTDGHVEMLLTGLEVRSTKVDATLSGRMVVVDEEGDEELIWSALGVLSEIQDNEDLTRTIRRYVRELGPAVEPYVAPLFLLTKRVVDTMPQPTLTEQDISDKIDLTD